MTETDSTHTDLIIAGGGPVGLFLALLMLQNGKSVTILEKRNGIDHHSKALGIHPVSLELFRDAGIAEPFVESGIRIKRGFAYLDRNKIGVIDFEKLCPEPFSYILALPQYQTETILEQEVRALNPDSIVRGAEVRKISHSADGVSVVYRKHGVEKTIRGTFLAGCDGKNSVVRQSAGIPYTGNPYPDTYIMGDFEENTPFGTDAAVYLHRHGLIEAFPLPNGMRRWVIKTEQFIEEPVRDELIKRVEKQIGHSLKTCRNTMMSSFGVQHYLAERFHEGRIVLAGDSAHVVSPIGGQGMNLGWLNGYQLAMQLLKAMDQPDIYEQHFRHYSKEARKRAKVTAKRAELNMWLGRARSYPAFRNLLARLMVQTPLKKKAARMFTMRGI